jgi:hypothetical protein
VTGNWTWTRSPEAATAATGSGNGGSISAFRRLNGRPVTGGRHPMTSLIPSGNTESGRAR